MASEKDESTGHEELDTIIKSLESSLLHLDKVFNEVETSTQASNKNSDDLHGMLSEFDGLLDSLQQIAADLEFNPQEEHPPASPIVEDSVAVTTLDPVVEEAKIIAQKLVNGPARLSSAQAQELNEDLNILIAHFDNIPQEEFTASCNNLIEKYGFNNYRGAIDELMMQKYDKASVGRDEVLKNRENKTLSNALRAMNDHLINNMETTFSSLLLEGMKTQSKAILEILKRPDADFQTDALEKIASIKKEEIAAAEKNAEVAMAEINKSDKTPAEKEAEIEKIKEQLVATRDAINHKEYPIKDYIDYARMMAFKKFALFTEDVGQNTYLIGMSIKRDILSSPSVAEATIKMERYVLVAERLRKENNVAAAILIAGELTIPVEISRIKAIHEGLSSHAKSVLQDLNTLGSFNENGADLRAIVEKNPTEAYLPAILVCRDLEVATAKVGSAKTFLNMDVEFDAMKKQHEAVMKLTTPQGNNAFIQELTANKANCAQLDVGAIKKEIERRGLVVSNTDKLLYARSSEFQARGVQLDASRVMNKVEQRLRPLSFMDKAKITAERLEHSVRHFSEKIENADIRSKISSRLDSIQEKMRTVVKKLQTKIESRSKVHSEIKELFQKEEEKTTKGVSTTASQASVEQTKAIKEQLRSNVTPDNDAELSPPAPRH
jgi:hypothetical protein